MKKQQGVVMMIALIALAAMSLAAISLMRTVDTTNVISGNLSFNEATVQMADIGYDNALNWINGNTFLTAGSCQSGGPCQSFFSPNASALDAKTKLPCSLYGNGSVDGQGNCVVGTPTLHWSDGSDQIGTAPTGTPIYPLSPDTSYQVRYAIERMCGTLVGGATQTTVGSGNPPTFANCMTQPLYDPLNGSLLPNSTTAASGRLYFRVTVQVTGPKNTQAMMQYFPGINDAVN